MDDVIVTENDVGEILRLGTYMSNEFEIMDLKSLKYFIGIEVACLEGEIFLSKQKHILDLLRR